MADLSFIRPNRLRAEAHRYRRRLLAVGLPDDYTVFNQVVVPNGGSCREIDFIVAGPNGIFAIEVKHHRGEIRGAESDKAWRQCQRSRRGNTYEQEQRNPVAQVKSAVYVLKGYFAAHGVNNWIQGIVVFTHPECQLCVGAASVPVLRLAELAAYVTGYQPIRPPRKRGTVIRALTLLREASDPACRAASPLRAAFTSGRMARRQPPYPQPVSYFMRNCIAPTDRVRGTMDVEEESGAT